MSMVVQARIRTTTAMALAIASAIAPAACTRAESPTLSPVVEEHKSDAAGTPSAAGPASGERPGHAAAQRSDPTPRTPMAPVTIRDAKGAAIATLIDDGSRVRFTGVTGADIAHATVRAARVDVDRPDGTRAASVMCRVGGLRVTDGDDRELLRLKGSRSAFKVASVHGDTRAERGLGKTPDGTEVRVEMREGGASIVRGDKPFAVVDGASDLRALFLFAFELFPLESRLALLVFTATVDCSRPSEDDEAAR
jgi:hypothetical protein